MYFRAFSRVSISLH